MSYENPTNQDFLDAVSADKEYLAHVFALQLNGETRNKARIIAWTQGPIKGQEIIAKHIETLGGLEEGA